MVEYLWNNERAAALLNAAGDDPADRQLALHLYGSRLIGGNPALVQHGGGNTSCKVARRDLFGTDRDVLHIKGSGQDLATVDAQGMPGVYLQPLLALRELDRLGDSDMVNATRANMLDTTGPTPSIETLLHAYLPHNFINHTHATAMLALANLPNAQDVVQEIFGDTVAVVPFFIPGFELATAAAAVFEANPNVEGLLLINHGHFAFADNAKDAYDRVITQTNKVEAWLQSKSGQKLTASGKALPAMVTLAAAILPVLRGLIGARIAEFSGDTDAPMPVMDLRAGPNVQAFLARPDIELLASRGVATPDHVIRTKRYPLVLGRDILAGGNTAIAKAVDTFIDNYTRYFHQNAAKHPDGKTMLTPTPNLAWIEGGGVVGIGSDAKAARIAADLAEQNIAAMSYGEDCGGFHPVTEAQLFDMEYWALEQAKLGKSTPPPLAGRVVLITGGAGAIGLAEAKAFAAQGANIFLVDLNADALTRAVETLGVDHGGVALDITEKGGPLAALSACTARFGGLDILLSNAGAAFTGNMADLEDDVLRQSFELNFFAHQNFAQAAAAVFRQQNRGGQVLFNVSKQAVNPGKGFGAYGLPKAATFFLLRQLALELGPEGVRVNGVNADRIRSGLLDDAFIAARAKARGIDEGTYMAGNLLGREVLADHVADAFVALALSARTTAHVMTVDGGNIEAALR